MVVVLLIYAVLFLPGAVWAFVPGAKSIHAFHNTSVILLYCSPLADLTLYVFIRKGVVDQLLAFLCCCKMSGKQETSSVTNDNASTSCIETL
ncbi:unnamed protein product [Menidia menidia]|uniref:(Atlantic silverside) hypothetical protein n=1 Tax=Menidia menidia TaxID=238744 RepID=A0A8S4BVX6_9TELE|nr:unnamed protein product [Menidia menidia]